MVRQTTIKWRGTSWTVDYARHERGVSIYSMRAAGERDAQTFSGPVQDEAGEHVEALAALSPEERDEVCDLVAHAISCS